MKYNKIVGNFGESLAKDYLISKGYEIIASNLKVGHLEIDIIAKISKITVFVEVKTSLQHKWGSAEDAIDSKKIDNTIEAAQEYIFLKKIDENFVRLDFIAVDIFRSSKMAKIKHFKNII